MAIKEYESGGDCSRTGRSGETGCYQFMPGTWVLYSREVFGRIAPQTPGNEEYVATKMIESWIEDGYTTKQIVLKWNHPAGATYGCGSGVNAQGVAWDSCDYQRQVLAILWRN